MSNLYSLAELAGREQAKLAAGEVRPNGLASGIGLERLCPGGIPRDKVTAVYADEGTFKTTLTTHMMHSIAAAGHKVVNVSLEDSAELCAHRALGRMSGVSFGRINGGVLSEEERARVVAAQLSDAMQNIFVVDDVEPTMDRALAAARAVPGCAALVVDYIQLLDDGKDQKSTLDASVRKAQLFAKSSRIAVILVSQRVKVDDQHREDPRPQTKDMFGSSAMRMGVKLAVGLFRPWNYCKVPTNAKGAYGPYVKWISSNPDNAEVYKDLLEVHVTKNVLGPPGAYHVLVHPETGVIEPYTVEGFAR